MKKQKQKNIELTQVLVKKGHQAELYPTKISQKWLQDLFFPDNIKDSKSNKMLDAIGGISGLEEQLKTSSTAGISGNSSDKSQRQRKYGKNDPIVKEMKTIWDHVLDNFEDQTMRILCFAAAASLILGIATHGWGEGWIEGVSILLAVVIVTVVASFNNYMKDQQFRKLNEVATRKFVNVTRNNHISNMNVFQLLVGDLVQIQTGEVLSVDGIVIKNNRLAIDESSMTGQSQLVKKSQHKFGMNNNDCFMISGTQVAQGTGMMIVTGIGQFSTLGKLRASIQGDDDQTPLQQKLAVLADLIGYIGIYSASVTFLVLFLHLLYDCFFQHKHQFFSLDSVNAIIDYFIIAVTLVVAAVPQGLPLAVTISLAYSVGKMKDQNNLVRYLNACETMGGANNICSDKTGTLTQNKMTVVQLWAQDKIVQEYNPDNKQLNKQTKRLLSIGSCLNSDALPQIGKNGKFDQRGNRTECALLQMAYKFGYNFNNVRKQQKVVGVVPFSSQRKKMSAIVKLQDGKHYIFSKGAPDFLFANCTHYLNKQGEVSTIGQHYTSELDHNLHEFASHSLRTILLCYRQISELQANPKNQQDLVLLQSNLVVIGMTGIKDPLKKSVPSSVQRCKDAGIITRMVTGDNIQTAIAIAKDANIIPKDYYRPPEGPGHYVVMEGKQLKKLTGGFVKVQKDQEQLKQEGYDFKNKDTQTLKKNKAIGLYKKQIGDIQKFKQVANQLRVLARSSPQDKLILVTGLKQLDAVVAVTGDGGNDAPALKKADIGFAMGIAGHEIAKQASGIILLDDNFSSIITAVKYGRNIFDCIRKFLIFQLTVNVVALFMAFIGAVILKQSPLSAVQLLWVNLIMDTLAALALATQPPSDQLLERMPYSRKQHIITPFMWRSILTNAVFQIIILSFILFDGDQIFDIPYGIGIPMNEWNHQNGQHISIFFNVFVFLQVFNFFNARKLKKDDANIFENVCNNYLFIGIIVIIFVCQIVIVQIGGKSFKLVPLTVDQHITCTLFGALSLVSGFICKKLIPESFMNNFELFRQKEKMQKYDVDNIFQKYFKHLATTIRKSKQERLSQQHHHEK